MPQSLSKVLVHIVYSTKSRQPSLKDERIRKELFAYKATILRDNVDTPALIINGMEDHIFSVSETNCEQVKRYIEEQERHHRKMSFQDEFRLLCKRHGIEIDERCVWD